MNQEKWKSYLSHKGFEPVTSLRPDNKKLADNKKFAKIKIPAISDGSEKYIFVANLSADVMYMVRSDSSE